MQKDTLLKEDGHAGPSFLNKKNFLNKKENGDVIDQAFVLLTTIFIFVILLSFMSYAKIVKMKLDVDHIAKRYLYIMEQYGYLPKDINGNTIEDMKQELTNIGCDGNSFHLDETVTQYGEEHQVNYGNEVDLRFTILAPNPLYNYVHGDKMFIANWIPETLDITVEVKSTSKW